MEFICPICRTKINVSSDTAKCPYDGEEMIKTGKQPKIPDEVKKETDEVINKIVEDTKTDEFEMGKSPEVKRLECQAKRFPLLAALLTIFLGIGIGHMYAGLIRRGLIFFIIFAISIAIAYSVVIFSPILGIMLLIFPLLFIVYTAIDAYRRCKMGPIQSYNRWYYYILACIVLFYFTSSEVLLIKATIVQAYMIPTGAMKPTIKEGDRLLGNRLIYHFQHPHRGDIIVFIPPQGVGDGKTPFLKRLVAVSGDTVEIKEGNVIVNGKVTDEPYIQYRSYSDMDALRVPNGDLFVLGDNRANSYDSSKWGFLPEKNVQAKAYYRFWPPDRIGKLK